MANLNSVMTQELSDEQLSTVSGGCYEHNYRCDDDYERCDDDDKDDCDDDKNDCDDDWGGWGGWNKHHCCPPRPKCRPKGWCHW